ncbi:MAG: PHP domain-containing protein [Candidatus Krumholzibacteria bacterium]|nr:PHP domain-containing protein [Candidatus Krumholzibacteria bacterium]
MEQQTAPCDLHLHSTYSDGTMSPEEIVSYASAIGLSAVSITDHDTVNAQAEALDAGRRCGIDVVTGIEFSIEENGGSIHLLGYCLDHENRALAGSLEELAGSRVTRAEEIVRKLEEHGVSIPFEDVLAEAGGGCVGRPHIARVLKRRGHVSSVSEAFARYISDSAPCHVPKKVLPRGEVVRLISGAGGVAVWAHPGWNIRRKDLVERLIASGVRGIEVWHPNHTERMRKDILELARERGLVCTGGSDFHFIELIEADIGEITAPCETVSALRKAAAEKLHLA